MDERRHDTTALLQREELTDRMVDKFLAQDEDRLLRERDRLNRSMLCLQCSGTCHGDRR
jgi:hypothetical protein